MSTSFPRATGSLAALLLAFLACACAATLGSSPRLQRDVDNLRITVDRLRQENAETRAHLEALNPPAAPGDIESEVSLLRDRIDALQNQLRELARALDGNDEIVGSLSYDLERLRRHQEDLARGIRALSESRASQAASPGTAGVARPAGLPSSGTGSDPSILPEEDPAGVFQKAYADYARGDYDLAILGLTRVLEYRPDGALADDAAYYLGEIARAQGRNDEALRWYTRVTEEYVDADKVPAATLKKGLLLIDINRIGEGVVQLDHLVRTHPESHEARLARNKLRALGVGP